MSTPRARPSQDGDAILKLVGVVIDDRFAQILFLRLLDVVSVRRQDHHVSSSQFHSEMDCRVRILFHHYQSDRFLHQHTPAGTDATTDFNLVSLRHE